MNTRQDDIHKEEVSPKKNGKKKLLILGAALIVIAMVTLSIIMRNREKLPEVEGTTVTRGNFIHEVSANGEITSKMSTAVYSTVTAKIRSLPVEIGDRVAGGDVLVLLDKESLENNLISAENALENARMTVRGELLNLRTTYTGALTGRDQALREYRRTEELHKIGSVSDEDLRRQEEALLLAEDTLLSARQRLNFREGRRLDDPRTETLLSDNEIVARAPEVRRAEIDRNNIRQSLEDYRITAEKGGIITDLPLEAGGVVSPGTLVARIQDADALEVTVGIDEVDLSFVVQGQPVKIISDSFLDRELPGTVASIDPVIRKIGDSRVCEITVDIPDNPGGIARIGASASVFIIVETKEEVPEIPVEAYFFEDEKKKVILLKASPGEDPESPERYTASFREITTGILGIETVEVTSGLEAGDLIIAGRNPLIEEGMEVRLAEGPDEEKE